MGFLTANSCAKSLILSAKREPRFSEFKMWTCWGIQVVADEKDPLPQKIELGDNALPGVAKGLVVGEDMSWVVVDIPVGLDERAMLCSQSRKIPTFFVSRLQFQIIGPRPGHTTKPIYFIQSKIKPPSVLVMTTLYPL